jgi:hypothetical protein
MTKHRLNSRWLSRSRSFFLLYRGCGRRLTFLFLMLAKKPILSGFSLKKSQTWQSSLCKEAKNVLKAV